VVKLKRQIAERSLEWRDEDKVSFLWGDLLVLAYVREDYRVWYALTELPILEAIEINDWLGKHLQTLEATEEDEPAL
jgi:hypothetical protein